MKSRVIFLFTIALSVFCISCASTKVQTINSTMTEAQFNLSSLSRDQYVIIGAVQGEGRITVKTSLLEKQAKSKALNEVNYNAEDISGDNGKYGFLNSKINTNMTVIDKAIAMATYKMIQAAQYNNADTVIYATTTTTIVPNTYSPFSNESFVIAKVSGLAVKIKPDVNAQVKIPTESEREQFDDVELEKIEKENVKSSKKASVEKTTSTKEEFVESEDETEADVEKVTTPSNGDETTTFEDGTTTVEDETEAITTVESEEQ